MYGSKILYLAAKGSLALPAGGGGLRLFLRVSENGSPEVLKMLKCEVN